MTYRQDLAAAHGRIHQLEAELEAKDALLKRGSEPAAEHEPEHEPEAPASDVEIATTAPQGLSLLHAWPALALVVLGTTYLVRFGGTLPAESSVSELSPFERGGLLTAILGAAIMFVAYLLRIRAGGESTVGQRLLTVLAAVVSAPFLVSAGIVVMHVGSIVFGVAMLAIMAFAGVMALIGWIRGD